MTKTMTYAERAVLDELHELLDLVQSDGAVHDLDKVNPGSLSVLGSTLYGLMVRIENLETSFQDIRDAVLHERYQLAETGLDCDQVNAVLGIIDDHTPQTITGE